MVKLNRLCVCALFGAVRLCLHHPACCEWSWSGRRRRQPDAQSWKKWRAARVFAVRTHMPSKLHQNIQPCIHQSLSKLADRSLSPSLLAHTRRLSRCREEAGVQHNRQEAHHRQDERPTPGGGTGSARRRAAHAAACSAAIKRSWGQEPGRKDPKATSRGHGGGSITRSDRHPPARTRPTRGQARQPKRGTISASAASEHAHADRIRSVPEPSAEPGVHEPMASAHCDRD